MARNSLSNPDFLPMGGSTMPPPEVKWDVMGCDTWDLMKICCFFSQSKHLMETSHRTLIHSCVDVVNASFQAG